jgi:hypothetical protein
MTQKLSVMLSLAVVWAGLQTNLAVDNKEVVQPVSDSQASDRATFEADYDRVWQVVCNLLSEYRFEFARKDKNTGQIETGYVVLSKHPTFSKLSSGVRTFAIPPKAFLRKWSDGRIKVVAQISRLSDASTLVVLRPDIQGFAATRGDDTGVTGEWRECHSNGKFEFELLNQVATELQKSQYHVANPPASAGPEDKKEVAKEKEPKKVEPGNSDVIFQSVPEGAEIYLNDKLIGMTPTRLSLSAGEYKIKFHKTGYKEFQKEFVLFPHSDITVATEMDKESP